MAGDSLVLPYQKRAQTYSKGCVIKASVLLRSRMPGSEFDGCASRPCAEHCQSPEERGVQGSGFACTFITSIDPKRERPLLSLETFNPEALHDFEKSVET